ncbi:unnamed protein product [Absidia cylindrospora]
MVFNQKHLTEFDDEDMIRQSRVEAHVKNQQQYTYPVIPVDPSGSPTDRDISLEKSQGVKHRNDEMHAFNDMPFYRKQQSPPPVMSLMGNEQQQIKRPSASHQYHRYRKGRKTTWYRNKNQHQRSKNKSAGRQKQAEQHSIQHKKTGLYLLEKFTSPNIEIDHITVKHRSKPRLGLFNKGKSSARGKGVADLVFSEASFLGYKSPQRQLSPSMIKDSIIDENCTGNINLESSSRPTPLPSSVSPLEYDRPLSEEESCPSDEIYDFFESAQKNYDPSVKQPTISATGTPRLQDTVASTTKSVSYHQDVTPLPAQSLGKAVLIEPDPHSTDNGQHNARGLSEFRQWTTKEMTPLRNQQQQFPHYTRGVTPLDTTRKSNKENTYNNTAPSYKGDTTDNIDTHKDDSDVWYDSFGCEPLRAWDSTSMINHPQHFRNQRSDINNHLQLHENIIDPHYASSPLAKLGIFKHLGVPVPFRPNNKHRPLYALPPHTDLTTTEQVQHHPRLPPMQPIYNVKDPMKSELLYHFDDPLGHRSSSSGSSTNSNSNNNNNITSTSISSSRVLSNHGLDATYRWQPNYQFNPGTHQHDVYEQNPPSPLNCSARNGDDGKIRLSSLFAPSHIPSTTHSLIVKPSYSPL